MTQREQRKKAMDRVERMVVSMLPERYNSEDIFWLRVDRGMSYLLRQYSYEEAREIWLEPTFWVWWRWAWHQNDLKLMNYIDANGLPLPMTWELYVETMEAKMMKYRVSPQLIKSAK